MARADATCVPARAGTFVDLAVWLQKPIHARLRTCEPHIRNAIVPLVCLYICIVAAVTLTLDAQSRSQAINQAHERLDSLSEQIVLRAAAHEPPFDFANVANFAALLPADATLHGRSVVAFDAHGAVIAHAPLASHPPASLRMLLGAKSELAVMGDGAGIISFVAANGASSLARIRNLKRGAGQIVVVQAEADAYGANNAIVAGFSTLLAGATGLALCLSLFVLSQARRAEAAEDVCEQFYSRVDTALDSGRGGLWDWDIARGRIHWSASMFRILGLEAQAPFMSVDDMRQLLHPHDDQVLDLAGRIADGTTDHIDSELRLRAANGEWLWFRVSARVVHHEHGRFPHLVGIAADISEHKRQAESRARADAQVRDAVEQISEAFVLWDSKNKLVLSNSKFRQLHGLQEHHASEGMSYDMVMSAATTPAIATMREIVPFDNDESRTIETELSDGRWLQISERRTRDGGFVSVGADITHVKRHEEELIDSERRLTAMVTDLKRSRQAMELQAQQMAELAERYLEQKAEAESANHAKAQFLANMSHELHTPLNAIIGFSEMMCSGVFGDLDARYQQYTADIRDSGRYLLGIIDDILEMSRIESGRKILNHQTILVDEVTTEALIRVDQDAANKKISIASERLNEVRFCVDPTAVQQVLIHLLQNAIKFTPEGGHVAIRARHSSGQIALYVEDNGIGIPR
ncbi:MAG: PAS domain-containing sensor histidine kinase, partial [Beijerinckiaceae bacterium]